MFDEENWQTKKNHQTKSRSVPVSLNPYSLKQLPLPLRVHPSTGKTTCRKLGHGVSIQSLCTNEERTLLGGAGQICLNKKLILVPYIVLPPRGVEGGEGGRRIEKEEG